MEKIYRSDWEAIESDKRVRRAGNATELVAQSESRANEYIEFLDKCADHALRCGDYEISINLRMEICRWEVVDDRPELPF